MVAGFDSAPCRAQLRSVAGEVGDGLAEPPDDGADPIVDGRQPVDDTPVVFRVSVVVGDTAGPHLPVVTHTDELGVEWEELRVRGRGGIHRITRNSEGEVGRDSSVGSQDEVFAARDRMSGCENVHACRSVGGSDLSAEADLEKERSLVHAERISRRVVACAHMRNLGTGTIVFEAKAVRGVWRMLQSPDDVLGLMEIGAEGVIAGVQDAGATFLAPIFDELTAVVCMSGTPSSHIGIVSREYRVPCLMATDLVGGMPEDGAIVEVDCSDDIGIVRAAG